jgi:hypothetical protein
VLTDRAGARRAGIAKQRLEHLAARRRYAYTIRDKVSENHLVMQQLANNTAEQALLGNFASAVDDAIMDRKPQGQETSGSESISLADKSILTLRF